MRRKCKDSEWLSCMTFQSLNLFLFKKGKLVRFSKPMTSDFEMILSGQKSGFPYTNTYVEFYSDKDYGVRNFHTEKVILFETFEEATKANMKLEAYIVRGFVSSRSSKKKGFNTDSKG
jgi:hypothetical protein